MPADLSPIIIDDRHERPKTYYFYNNVIYNLSPTASYQWKKGANRTFSHNLFYGHHPESEPADPHKLTGDPLLIAPGTGVTGDLGSLAIVDVYQVRKGVHRIVTRK